MASSADTGPSAREHAEDGMSQTTLMQESRILILLAIDSGREALKDTKRTHPGSQGTLSTQGLDVCSTVWSAEEA